jgi:hypothetical protein
MTLARGGATKGQRTLTAAGHAYGFSDDELIEAVALLASPICLRGRRMGRTHADASHTPFTDLPGRRHPDLRRNRHVDRHERTQAIHRTVNELWFPIGDRCRSWSTAAPPTPSSPIQSTGPSQCCS